MGGTLLYTPEFWESSALLGSCRQKFARGAVDSHLALCTGSFSPVPSQGFEFPVGQSGILRTRSRVAVWLASRETPSQCGCFFRFGDICDCSGQVDLERSLATVLEFSSNRFGHMAVFCSQEVGSVRVRHRELAGIFRLLWAADCQSRDAGRQTVDRLESRFRGSIVSIDMGEARDASTRCHDRRSVEAEVSVFKP